MSDKQFVVLKVGNEEFGVDIMQVKEIIRLPEIVKVPNTPTFIEGIINLRGKVHPVINLRKRLGYSENKFDNNSRVIIVNIDDVKEGFIVDEVTEIVRIDDSNIEYSAEIVSDIDDKFIKGVGKIDDRMIILLNLKTLSSVDKKV